MSIEIKTGLKTIDKLAEIPVVLTTLGNIQYYYNNLKEMNSLTKATASLAQGSFNKGKTLVKPVFNYCNKPIESVDTYLYNKVEKIEQIIVKSKTQQDNVNKVGDLSNKKNAMSGMKTLNKLAHMPFVAHTLENVNDYYYNVKEQNTFTRATCSMVESSCKIGIDLIAPVVTLCNKQINSVDIYLFDTVEKIEKAIVNAKHQKENCLIQDSEIGLKTINKIVELPLVATSLDNVSYCYNNVKQLNFLTKCTASMAEGSYNKGKNLITPVVNYCNKPINVIDSFLSDKVEKIENKYPSIKKPTKEMLNEASLHVKSIYDTNLKQTIEKGSQLVEICLENKHVESLVVLTKRCLSYMRPKSTTMITTYHNTSETQTDEEDYLNNDNKSDFDEEANEKSMEISF